MTSNLYRNLRGTVSPFLTLENSTPFPFACAGGGVKASDVAAAAQALRNWRRVLRCWSCASWGRNPRFDDWKNKDPGERGRRIWIWWHRVHQIEKGSLEAFWQVMRSVVLNQASSASVERVFSQLNCTCRTIGVGALDETVETRLKMRVNSSEKTKDKKKWIIDYYKPLYIILVCVPSSHLMY